MKRFNATIYLPDVMSDKFWKLIPAHRLHIGKLMNDDIIETYSVNMARTKGWITLNAKDEGKAHEIIESFPISPFITFEIEELFIFDNALNALPKLIMN
jgi:hypothetical protein